MELKIRYGRYPLMPVAAPTAFVSVCCRVGRYQGNFLEEQGTLGRRRNKAQPCEQISALQQLQWWYVVVLTYEVIERQRSDIIAKESTI